jgi:catechol 2,3-dioxygenase-like lactoylglutathione lyase family enzyme
MKPRLNFVTLGVADIARAKTFYKRLGLAESNMGSEHVGFFDINGVVLAVFGHEALAHDANVEAVPPPPFRGVSLAWNAESPEEVDAILEHAIEAGAKLVKAAEEVFWGGYSGYFSDPDGHLWEVAHNPYVKITKEGHIKLP